MINVLGTLLVAVIGLAAGILIYQGYRELSKGTTKQLMVWLLMTVMLCGFPYAVWNFLLESGLVAIEDPSLKEIPGIVLVFLFFLFMLRASMIVKKIGKDFGFRDEAKIIAKKSGVESNRDRR